MTYHDIIQSLRTVYEEGEAKAIARMLLEERFGLSMTDILCGKVSELSADNQQELRKMTERLLQSEPIQYVLGEAVFCRRSFRVAPGVLIPRPETEELCRWVKTEVPEPQILDIGTGSGCIAITLAADIPGSRVTAWDISDDALFIARENAQRLKVEVVFEKKDLFREQQPVARWHVIVSNPPYIFHEESQQMERNVLDYEPHEALFAPDNDPNAVYEAIGRYAATALYPGGSLYLELNPIIAEDVANSLRKLGLSSVELRKDQFGRQRFIKATKTT